MERYLRTQDINMNRCNALGIRSWILGALKMRKNTRDEKENNIR